MSPNRTVVVLRAGTVSGEVTGSPELGKIVMEPVRSRSAKLATVIVPVRLPPGAAGAPGQNQLADRASAGGAAIGVAALAGRPNTAAVAAGRSRSSSRPPTVSARRTNAASALRLTRRPLTPSQPKGSRRPR